MRRGDDDEEGVDWRECIVVGDDDSGMILMGGFGWCFVCLKGMEQ